MRIVLSLAALFVVMFSFSEASAADWETLRPGMHYKVFKVDDMPTPVAVHVLKLDPSKVVVKPVMGSHNMMAPSLGSATGALAVVNANFFDTEGKVLGLVKQDGRTIHALKPISWWSVFCVQRNKAKIVHTTRYLDNQCEQAVQAGPRLVVDGALTALNEKISRKTAVGINGHGDVLLVVTNGALPITRFAKLLAESESNGGLGCVQAMNLDGGSSSQMSISGAALEDQVMSYVTFPVGLGVFEE